MKAFVVVVALGIAGCTNIPIIESSEFSQGKISLVKTRMAPSGPEYGARINRVYQNGMVVARSGLFSSGLSEINLRSGTYSFFIKCANDHHEYFGLAQLPLVGGKNYEFSCVLRNQDTYLGINAMDSVNIVAKEIPKK